MKARFLYRAFKARFRGERSEIRALREHLRAGDVAVDVGANKGAYLYWMREAVGPSGRVFAFEPQPRLARYLGDAGEHMGWSNLSVRPCALSDRPGRRVLHVPGQGDSPGATLEDAARAALGRELEVETDTLDRQLGGAGVDRVALVKVDVEGHELAVFRGAERTLSESMPVLLFESEARHLAPGSGPREVFAFLEDRGYRGEFFAPDGLRPIGEFDPDVHQRREPGRFWEAPGYCNNFLFRRA